MKAKRDMSVTEKLNSIASGQDLRRARVWLICKLGYILCLVACLALIIWSLVTGSWQSFAIAATGICGALLFGLERYLNYMMSDR